jgi:hypothetical protein
MKHPLKSKTIRTAMLMATTAVVTLIMHHTGSLEASPQVLGAAWTAVVSAAMMVALRYATTSPIGPDKVSAKEEAPQ